MNESLRRGLMRVLGVALVMATPIALRFVLPAAWWALPFLLMLIGIGAAALQSGWLAGLLATSCATAAFAIAGEPGKLAPDARDVVLLIAGAGALVTLMTAVARRDRLQADADRAALRRQMHERAAAELRLRASEQRFRTVVDALPDTVFTADVEGRTRLLSNQWIDVPPTRGADDDSDLFGAVHPEDEGAVRARWSSAVTLGRTFDVRCRLRSRDQQFRWVLLRAQASSAAALAGHTWFGVIVDIERTVAAERALREVDERLHLALDATGLGLWDYDFATDAATCSPRVYAILGLPEGSRVDLATWRALVAPQDEAMVISHARAAIASAREDGTDGGTNRAAPAGTLGIDYRIRRADDGAERWVALTGRVAYDRVGTNARLRRASGTLRDVTADRLAAQRLEASEERFRLAAEALDGLIYDYEPANDGVERSRGLREVTGFDVGEVPATGAWWQGRIHRDDRGRVGASLDKALAARAPRLDQEYRIRHRDGHFVHVNDRAHLVWLDGTLQRRVGVVTDVTERRRIERVLRDADRRKDEFLAVLAHELRNPLAPIRNAVQVITRAADAQVIAGAAAMLERQVSQMVRLIDDLLDVSRIAQGKLRLRRQPTALAPIVEAAIETVQPLFHARGQSFACTRPAGDVTIEADAVRLSQVLANLLHNASKYTPAGGAVALETSIDATARNVELRVIDSGIGIEPQSLEMIFTMFSQVPRGDDAGADATRHDGLGIGLALARAVVGLHSGTLHATSDGPGRGAQFVLRLPLVGAAPAVQNEGREEAPARRRRVLVVDDNRDSAESLAAVLRLDRHEVFVAYGGRDALRIAEIERPDLVLLDIGMPDLDGYEVARLLRAGDSPPARIVALSGYGQVSDREKSFAAGCDAHLVKPVALVDLAVWLGDGPARDDSAGLSLR